MNTEQNREAKLSSKILKFENSETETLVRIGCDIGAARVLMFGIWYLLLYSHDGNNLPIREVS